MIGIVRKKSLGRQIFSKTSPWAKKHRSTNGTDWVEMGFEGVCICNNSICNEWSFIMKGRSWRIYYKILKKMRISIIVVKHFINKNITNVCRLSVFNIRLWDPFSKRIIIFKKTVSSESGLCWGNFLSLIFVGSLF